MIRKLNFKLSLKYALGELVLIFLGISLAIAFQNWNDNRKVKRQALEILSEIEENLAQDITALNELVDVRSKDLEATKRVIQLFSEKRPFDTKISEDLGRVILGSQIYFREFGYNLLEESHIAALSNLSLRKMLDQYYEQSINFVNNDVKDDKYEFQTILLPYVRSNFDSWGYRQASTPINYNLMLKDKFFLSSLKISVGNCQSTLNGAKSAIIDAEELLVALQAEIKKG